MKKIFLIAVCATSVTLAASAHSRDDGARHLGRRDDDRTLTVPDATSTFGLMAVALLTIGLFTFRYERRS